MFRRLFFRGCAGAALTNFSAAVFQRLRRRSSHQFFCRQEYQFWVHFWSFWGGGRTSRPPLAHPGGPECVQAGFSWNSGCFLPRLGVPWGAHFQTLRGPGPTRTTRSCENLAFRCTTGARMVFERQPPSPEVCTCNENILNNRVLARGPVSPIWCKLVPKRLPNGGLR